MPYTYKIILDGRSIGIYVKYTDYKKGDLIESIGGYYSKGIKVIERKDELDINDIDVNSGDINNIDAILYCESFKG